MNSFKLFFKFQVQWPESFFFDVNDRVHAPDVVGRVVQRDLSGPFGRWKLTALLIAETQFSVNVSAQKHYFLILIGA